MGARQHVSIVRGSDQHTHSQTHNNHASWDSFSLQVLADTIMVPWPSPPGTFHFFIGKFSYFVIRSLYHICFVINFSYLVIRFLLNSKVIHTKYSKHRPSTVAHTFECVCNKINHGLNHELFIPLLKLINCPIH